ncbi:short integuments 2, mitochondrial-like [Chenopodium quinoa]|uniref:short integuments 2, mitochondrial-like n=1 Tax=Chenopodium quinoa TaxID=63459 RepID=UPI000B77547B|nr:short integuments 2, mitochondrial-like [Chenopodium quinoa]
MVVLKKVMKKGLGEMGFNKGGGPVNWFPGHMAAASRAIRDRLKLADFVIEVRDSRIPLSSQNEELQPLLTGKRRIVALNKKDLANPNILPKWIKYFESDKQDCLSINAHSKTSVKKLLDLVELKLKEVISREPTLLVMVVGVPNVGKSALINNIHRISAEHFPVQERMKKAIVGPLPGVTQDIAGYKIAHQPSIYVLDTPGVLVPSIPDIETGLKLAATGSVKDSVVGEERIAQYLLAVFNSRGTPLYWKNLNDRKKGLQNGSEGKHEYSIKDLLPNRRKPPDDSAVYYIEDIVTEVQCALTASFLNFDGNLEDENDMESLIELQFEALQKAFKIPQTASECRAKASKKFLTLFRMGKLGHFILDDVPDVCQPVSSTIL